MIGDHEKAIYATIHRMVIWDEPDADVMKVLAVNGITDARAAELLAMARADRLATVRGDCLRQGGIGLLCLAAGIGLFLVFWLGFRFLPNGIIGISIIAAAFGLWKTVAAAVGLFTARSRRGSLADPE